MNWVKSRVKEHNVKKRQDDFFARQARAAAEQSLFTTSRRPALQSDSGRSLDIDIAPKINLCNSGVQPCPKVRRLDLDKVHSSKNVQSLDLGPVSPLKNRHGFIKTLQQSAFTMQAPAVQVESNRFELPPVIGCPSTWRNHSTSQSVSSGLSLTSKEQECRAWQDTEDRNADVEPDNEEDYLNAYLKTPSKVTFNSVTHKRTYTLASSSSGGSNRNSSELSDLEVLSNLSSEKSNATEKTQKVSTTRQHTCRQPIHETGGCRNVNFFGSSEHEMANGQQFSPFSPATFAIPPRPSIPRPSIPRPSVPQPSIPHSSIPRPSIPPEVNIHNSKSYVGNISSRRQSLWSMIGDREAKSTPFDGGDMLPSFHTHSFSSANSISRAAELPLSKGLKEKSETGGSIDELRRAVPTNLGGGEAVQRGYHRSSSCDFNPTSSLAQESLADLSSGYRHRPCLVMRSQDECFEDPHVDSDIMKRIESSSRKPSSCGVDQLRSSRPVDLSSHEEEIPRGHAAETYSELVSEKRFDSRKSKQEENNATNFVAQLPARESSVKEKDGIVEKVLGKNKKNGGDFRSEDESKSLHSSSKWLSFVSGSFIGKDQCEKRNNTDSWTNSSGSGLALTKTPAGSGNRRTQVDENEDPLCSSKTAVMTPQSTDSHAQEVLWSDGLGGLVGGPSPRQVGCILTPSTFNGKDRNTDVIRLKPAFSDLIHGNSSTSATMDKSARESRNVEPMVEMCAADPKNYPLIESSVVGSSGKEYSETSAFGVDEINLLNRHTSLNFALTSSLTVECQKKSCIASQMTLETSTPVRLFKVETCDRQTSPIVVLLCKNTVATSPMCLPNTEIVEKRGSLVDDNMTWRCCECSAKRQEAADSEKYPALNIDASASLAGQICFSVEHCFLPSSTCCGVSVSKDDAEPDDPAKSFRDQFDLSKKIAQEGLSIKAGIEETAGILSLISPRRKVSDELTAEFLSSISPPRKVSDAEFFQELNMFPTQLGLGEGDACLEKVGYSNDSASSTASRRTMSEEDRTQLEVNPCDPRTAADANLFQYTTFELQCRDLLPGRMAKNLAESNDCQLTNCGIEQQDNDLQLTNCGFEQQDQTCSKTRIGIGSQLNSLADCMMMPSGDFDHLKCHQASKPDGIPSRPMSQGRTDDVLQRVTLDVLLTDEEQESKVSQEVPEMEVSEQNDQQRSCKRTAEVLQKEPYFSTPTNVNVLVISEEDKLTQEVPDMNKPEPNPCVVT